MTLDTETVTLLLTAIQFGVLFYVILDLLALVIRRTGGRK